MTTFVISAFPGCGKSYCFNNCKELSILNTYSNQFNWIKNENGDNTTEINPEFPNNYVKYIKENIGKVDIIFVDTNEIVRNALLENNIRTILIYPHKHCKDEWIERLKNRGNNEKFIKFISDNWDKIIDELDSLDYDLGKYAAHGFVYSKIIQQKLNNTEYIDLKYLYSLTDNSMGNLSCLWGN